jgi:hypothetical protein
MVAGSTVTVRHPVAVHQVVVALLLVHEQAGQQRGVRQPAAAAGRGGGQVAAARAESGLPQRLRAGVQHRVDDLPEPRVLHRAAPVALHERQDHVLAAQPGQQLVGRHVRVRVGAGGLVVRGAVADIAAQRGHVLGEHRAVGPRGQRHPPGRRDAEHREGEPGHRERRGPAQHQRPVRGGHPGQPAHRQHAQHRDDHAQRDRGDHQRDRPGAADRVGHHALGRVQQPEVGGRVEQPVLLPAEAQVGQLEHGEHGQQPAQHRHRDPPPAVRQDHQQDRRDQRLDRQPDERDRLQVRVQVRQHQRQVDQQGGQHGEHPAGDHPAAAALRARLVLLGRRYEGGGRQRGALLS